MENYIYKEYIGDFKRIDNIYKWLKMYHFLLYNIKQNKRYETIVDLINRLKINYKYKPKDINISNELYLELTDIMKDFIIQYN